MSNKQEQELLTLIYELKEAIQMDNDENLIQITDCLIELFQNNIGLLYNEQNHAEFMDFFELIINEINSKANFDDFTIKCLYLLNVLSCDSYLCNFLAQTYTVVNELCCFLKENNFNLDKDLLKMIYRIIINLTRSNKFFLFDSNVEIMIAYCINKIIDKDNRKFYFQFLSNSVRNNEEMCSLLTKLDSFKSFSKQLFYVISIQTNSDIFLNAFILILKLYPDYFREYKIDNSTKSLSALDTIEFALMAFSEDKNASLSSKLIATDFLYEAFKAPELRRSLIKDEKLLSAILIKFSAALIDDTLDERLISVIIKILFELTQNDQTKSTLAKVIYDTREVLDKSRKMKQRFKLLGDDDDLFKAFCRLLNVKQDECSHFPLLCKVLYKTLKVFPNKQDRLKQMFNVLVGNFLQFDHLLKVDELLSEIANNGLLVINYSSLRLKLYAECTYWNLFMINYILKNVDKSTLFVEELDHETNIKEKLLDIFQKITIHPCLKNSIKSIKNVSIEKELLLVSADILLQLNRKPSGENNDSVFERNDDLSKMITLFLKNESFIKALASIILTSKDAEIIKLTYEVVFSMHENGLMNLEKFSNLHEAITRELSCHDVEPQKDTLTNINLQLINLKLNDSNRKSNSNKSLNEFYENELRRADFSNSQLLKQLNYHSQVNHRYRMENNLLLKRVNELEELNNNLLDKYKNANVKLEEAVRQLEAEKMRLKEESKRLKETLDVKLQEMELAEKENDEIVMKLKVDLENVMQAKKELTNKTQELQTKVSSMEKIKYNLESKLRDGEVALTNKQNELDAKQECLQRAESDNVQLAKENHKVKSDLERLKSVFSMVKNVDLDI